MELRPFCGEPLETLFLIPQTLWKTTIRIPFLQYPQISPTPRIYSIEFIPTIPLQFEFVYGYTTIPQLLYFYIRSPKKPLAPLSLQLTMYSYYEYYFQVSN